MGEGRRVRIAVDAMGGDHAPAEIVRGAVLAAQEDGTQIALVGHKETLQGELAKYRSCNGAVRLVEARDLISEDESPALAVRNKPDSSIAVATRLVRLGDADAVVSAGSSGAVAVSAMQHLGMIDGVERPTVGGHLGSFAPNVVMMDIGANADCKPYQFLVFAIIGTVLVRQYLGIPNPTVGLLSTGREEGKGNDLVRESYDLLRDSGLNFIGNIEGNDVLSGNTNVVVCDGFVGNILLKFYESIPDYALTWTKAKLTKYPPMDRIVEMLFRKLFPVTKMTNASEEKGSGILWGVNGVVRLAHGNCRAPAVADAIRNARNAVSADVIECVKLELARFKAQGKL